MRDIFEDIFINQPLDPTEAARRSIRPALRKRFYSAAGVGPEQEGAFPIMLDGRAVRTPARRALAAPTARLAHAVALEWEGQGETIDPARMPLTRLANTIIDGVAASGDAVRGEVAKYLGSDLVLYRAAEPEGLVRRQTEQWDPVVAWMRDTYGARFVLAQGIIHVAQPEAALAAAATLIPDEPWRLGAVHTITTITGSALLALAVAKGRLTIEDALVAAYVDEDWNIQQWGEDDVARQARAYREAEMRAAVTVLAGLVEERP